MKLKLVYIGLLVLLILSLFAPQTEAQPDGGVPTTGGQTSGTAPVQSPSANGAQSNNAPARASASPYDTGVDLYSRKKFAEALVQFESPNISASESANAAFYRALCYHQMGRTKEAIIAYKFVVTKFPQNAVAQNAIKALARLDPRIRQAIDNNPLNRGIDWTGLPDQVEVPYKKGFGGHMFVNAHINGAPVTMLFDTGASATTSPQSYLNEHGVIVHKTSVGGNLSGVGGQVPCYLALAEVQLGQLKRQIPIMVEEDAAAVLNNNTNPLRCPLLGQSFFKDVPYEIDDGQHVIIFKKPTPKGASTGYSSREVPYYLEEGHIIVRAKINGRECDMILDTGAGSVAFADRHLAQCGLNVPVAAMESGGGGVGGKTKGFVFYIDSISLGPVERRNVMANVLLNAKFPKPLLGQTFLGGLKYTIDPGRKVIRFD